MQIRTYNYFLYLAGTQGMNRYSYVLNNPLKYTDPSGYKPAPLYYDKESGGGGNNGVYFNIGRDYSGRGYNGASALIDISNARIDQMAGIVRDENGMYLYNSKNDVLTGQDAINWVINNGNISQSAKNTLVFGYAGATGAIIGQWDDGRTFIYSQGTDQVLGTNHPAGQGGYKDVTTAFDTHLETTMAYFSISRDWFDINYPKEGLGKEIDKMMIFRSKVNDNAVFDIKRTAFSRANLGAEYASENGTELNALLPKMSPLNPQYLAKKQSIFKS